MCCFAGRVSDVSSTSIFARVGGDREYLVYEMTFTSDDQTAMILPIPTASGAPEDVVKFVTLDGYPDFFRDLERHFQQLWAKTLTLGGAPPSLSLKVHLVGAFEASFVPRVEDFDRLDPRFRIPPQVWKQLPAYESFGFVCFKLQPGRRVSVHPMAFSFRTRDPETLFFPSVHVHDGLVHEEADFDHILYTQNKPVRRSSWPRAVWVTDGKAASQYLKVARTNGLVDKDVPCFQMSVVGSFPNRDVVVPI